MNWTRLLLPVLLALGLISSVTSGASIKTMDQPIMPLDDVRIGMKGYGLTVFHGTKIEPFPVEVVSVMRDMVNGPKRAVIWIRCVDERMQKTGPVSGMSGSPIYLWDEGVVQEELTGGRLAGAFALGFSGGKDCYVGVQPIELMRQVATRVNMDDAGDGQAMKKTGGPYQQMLRPLIEYARSKGIDEKRYWRLKMIGEHDDGAGYQDVANNMLPLAGPTGIRGEVKAMRLPLAVSNVNLAEMIAPTMGRFGMQPMVSPMAVTASRPPVEIDAGEIVLEPGAVLCIPMAYGDLDYSASGTVTDVLPDGTILAFGHAMYGQGQTALPIASGYVHFIQPGLMGSFKLSGSGVIRGGLVRDENSAVVGLAEGEFATVPVKVKIHRAGHEDRTYSYEVVQHPEMTGALTAIMAIESLLAESNLPLENTLRIKADLKFEGGREMPLDAISPMGSYFDIYSLIMPPVATMMVNEFKEVNLESATIDIEVIDEVKMAMLVGGRIVKNEVAPGKELPISVRLQPFGKDIYTKRIEMKIPQSLVEGNYEVFVCDANTYMNFLLSTRPHLLTAKNADELFDLWKMVNEIPNNALFMMMQSSDGQSLAIGRTELPALPSSRFAMLASPTDTSAKPYMQWITKQVDMDEAMTGMLNFTITVKREPGH